MLVVLDSSNQSSQGKRIGSSHNQAIWCLWVGQGSKKLNLGNHYGALAGHDAVYHTPPSVTRGEPIKLKVQGAVTDTRPTTYLSNSTVIDTNQQHNYLDQDDSKCSRSLMLSQTQRNNTQ